MNTCAKLTQILNDRKIVPKQDIRFLYGFEQSVLLTLKECGILTQTQLWVAEEKLKEQYFSSIRSQ